VERTVLIVDDHAAFRALSRRVLEAAGYDVVGEACDGAGALAEAERLRPAVVILDVQLPDLDGFEVAERLMAAEDAPAVVLVSSREASSYGRRVAASSARAFIPKWELTARAIGAIVA
jgi:DNA-binding NarL/FixJ family response regulator